MIWDESSRDAHYRNRPEGKPFFAVFNLLTSHESSIHPSEEGGMAPGEGYVLRHDPARVELPPYHPDVPAIRHDWALYYDKVEDMDAQVGNLLRELEEEGLAENTIVFYYSDHGGVLARSKRFLHETGTRVPFLVRIPESFKDLYPAAAPGDRVGRLISFVDLAPTLLSLAGEEIPVWMQGDAFLGVRTATAPTYVHLTRGRMDERIDMSRGVTDGRFRYIRNYMPYRISLPHLAYLFKAPSAQAWEDHFRAGLCDDLQSAPFLPKPVEELYDTRADPWEIHNLAGDPAHRDILDRMRAENRRWMAEVRDVGLIPETDYRYFSGDSAMYDYMRSRPVPWMFWWRQRRWPRFPMGIPRPV
ncbi:MAG: sulfatase-like hydrolase/transferase [Bacteroidales bacterium]